MDKELMRSEDGFPHVWSLLSVSVNALTLDDRKVILFAGKPLPFISKGTLAEQEHQGGTGKPIQIHVALTNIIIAPYTLLSL